MHSVVDLTLGDEDDELIARSPGGRKLKQSRLSFQGLRSASSSKPIVAESNGCETRKRKPSSDASHVDMPVAKVVRISDLQSPVEQDATDAVIAIDDSDPSDDEKIDCEDPPAPEATSAPRNCSPAKAPGTPKAVQSADPLNTTVTLSSSDEEGTDTMSTPPEKSVQTADGQPAVKRKLTAKQIARRQEHERKLALKEQEREDKRRKQQEEKEEKAREKEEQDRQRRREREERDEQKRKEREEKDKRRQSEIDQKNEERRRKEEEREAEEKRKAKVAKAFTNFFVKKPIAKDSTPPSKESDDDNSLDSNGALSGARFMPFCVKSDMRLAPLTRRTLCPAAKETLTQLLAADEGFGEDHYLSQLKRKRHQPIATGRTWDTKVDEDDDDIMIVDDSAYHQIEEDHEVLKQTMKAKFFLFVENRRPPYRGTWRKRSTVVRARCPFAQDKIYFDYEVDSDDEWEEEEPGESLHGSDDEKDVDPEEDYEVDNEFFVPHGHLSDEELQAEEDEDGGPTEDNSPEAQKAKIRIMQQEFVAEMKKKTEKIKPRLIGCIWQGSCGGSGSDIIMKILNDRAMLFDPADPISFTRASTTNGDQQDADSPGKRGPKKRRISEEAVHDLVRLVHGNVNNRKFLAREFQAFWAASQDGGERPELAMESVRNKIKEIAAWGACPLEGPMRGKHCWTVAQEVLEAHNLTQLALPNTWCYQLKGSNPVRLAKPSAAAVVTVEKGD
ncbi:chromatin assembly factor 1 subunit A-like [Anopheles cruzii]|uniref:chromatin assembly factor 1 subunit A-like n=1 Tax=Anopheles cruzii TaxID=68878 RepID=UPI0022EC273F|nr:chromatin assembly factor 1 subunit A-like [Anopheles cruzii]